MMALSWNFVQLLVPAKLHADLGHTRDKVFPWLIHDVTLTEKDRDISIERGIEERQFVEPLLGDLLADSMGRQQGQVLGLCHQ